MTPSAKERLPGAVAGVNLIDSEIAKWATDFSRAVYPPYLFNHAVRTFLFGSLVGRALGQKFDPEILYLACIFHDLGLTEKFRATCPSRFRGPRPPGNFWKNKAIRRKSLRSSGTASPCTLHRSDSSSNLKLHWSVRGPGLT